MKTTFFVFLLLCAASAFGQQGAGVISNQPQVVIFPDHPQHAERHDMALEHPIAGASADAYSYARGERPLWEFGEVTEPTPLGDVARAYRKEKSTAKKAEIIFEKQGS